MTMHTPGPWRAVPPEELMVNGQFVIDRADASEQIAQTWERADASLIAAAPRLRAALEQITRCAKMKGPVGTTAYIISDDRMAEAFAALAESDGR